MLLLKPSFIPAGLPVAVCVWWRGSRNLTQYLLQKVPNINPGRIFMKMNLQDVHSHIIMGLIAFCFGLSVFEAVEAVPDLLWPNAKEILCSSVSRCTRYIALGLDDGLVCVWDRQSGEQLQQHWVCVCVCDSV